MHTHTKPLGPERRRRAKRSRHDPDNTNAISVAYLRQKIYGTSAPVRVTPRQRVSLPIRLALSLGQQLAIGAASLTIIVVALMALYFAS